MIDKLIIFNDYAVERTARQWSFSSLDGTLIAIERYIKRSFIVVLGHKIITFMIFDSLIG